jgi:hypothetical protein
VGRVVAAGVLLVALLAGCGRFQTASSVSRTTSTAIVGTLAPLSTATTLAGVYHPTTAGHANTATTRDPCAPPNQSVLDDPSGFRLILTVAPRQCARAGDDLTLQLEIQNTSHVALQYDTTQAHFFDMIPFNNPSAPSWSDESCRTRDAFPPAAGPLTLAPGQRVVRAQATYPAPKNVANREDCRNLKGAYDAIANLVWCPSGSTVNGACDSRRTKMIAGAPLRVVLS